ncbi:MAG: hypothetical protein ACRDK3_14885 [Actinomycetota bacterium]
MNSDGSIAVNDHTAPPPVAPVWGADHCLVDREWSSFRDYLADRADDTVRVVLSIAEVERIIERRLPAEAALPQWWSNCPQLGECGRGKAWYVSGMPGHYLIELVRC